MLFQCTINFTDLTNHNYLWVLKDCVGSLRFEILCETFHFMILRCIIHNIYNNIYIKSGLVNNVHGQKTMSSKTMSHILVFFLFLTYIAHQLLCLLNFKRGKGKRSFTFNSKVNMGNFTSKIIISFRICIEWNENW